jgi:hypothetical protein
MREAPSYPPEPAQELGCADYPQHPDHQLYPDDQSYPAQAYPAYQESLAPPSEAAPLVGIHDGMMVRVKIGFVRSLEDELGMSTVSSPPSSPLFSASLLPLLVPPLLPSLLPIVVSGLNEMGKTDGAQLCSLDSSSTSTQHTMTAGHYARTRTNHGEWSP